MEASTTPPQAVEVDPNQALAEEANVDQVQARPRPGSNAAPKEDIVDILAPKKKAKEWGLGLQEDGTPAVTYVQRELSVITKAQWFELVGEFMEKTLGEVSLNTLISPPDSVRQAISSGASDAEFRPQDLNDADSFVQAISKLLMKFPDFMMNSICIWLSVPDFEWNYVKELMKLSPELGGLSDAMMFEMIEVFIDQNYAEIRRNFQVRIRSLRDRWQARTKEMEEQSSSQKR